MNKSSCRSVFVTTILRNCKYFKKLQEMFVNQENFLSTVDTY